MKGDTVNDEIQSETVLEMAAERDPAKLAAMQIIKGGRPDMTCGEAADLIERIVRKAITMSGEGRVAADAENPRRLVDELRAAWLAEEPQNRDGRFPPTQRAYLAAKEHGLTTRLVSDMADSELLALRGIGPATLAVLRRFAPRISQ